MRVKVINKRPASVLQKKRVCAYARVSTDSRRQEDSLENQMETYERLITGNPEYEFIGVFADQAYLVIVRTATVPENDGKARQERLT